VIRLAKGDARAEIVPQRGGMVTRFSVGERPILALDETTLADPTKNVRGGIPILFPIAGRLTDDKWSGGAMSQHGFARNLPWSVVEETPREATLSLESSTETRSRFPFDFRLDFSYRLGEHSLRIDQRYANRSPDPMPLHAGFHPYFFVPDGEKRATKVATRATRAFDNVTKQEIELAGPIDLTRKEVDLHLRGHGPPSSRLSRPGVEVALAASPELAQWVVWTLAGRDFVCVEPWTAPADALNTGQGLLWIAPGETRNLFFEISVSIPEIKISQA
jgi:galactose mutarotase-like enzyme